MAFMGPDALSTIANTTSKVKDAMSFLLRYAFQVLLLIAAVILFEASQTAFWFLAIGAIIWVSIDKLSAIMNKS
jgi:hypothetical protein